MSDEFTELENELKGLRPRSLPAPLIGRIATELNRAKEKRGVFASWRTWIVPVAASFALAVIVTSIPFLTRDRDDATPALQTPPAQATVAAPAPSRMRPVHATNVLYDAVNEGIVHLDDQTRARRMRLSYLDTITWEDPRGAGSVKWTVPREEIRFIPVSAN